MALPYTLHKGDIIVTQTDSLSGTTLPASPFLVFGEVQQVSDLEDMYSVGDVVLYNSEGKLNLQLTGVPYYLIKNTDILFKDGEPL